jgi:hypothetical protein
MAKKVSYLDNLKKELGQSFRAYQATGEMSQKSGPGTDERANMLRRKQDKAFGQLFGSALQGRRYDDKTGKQIKAKKK